MQSRDDTALDMLDVQTHRVMAEAFTDAEQACFSVSKFVLETHPALSEGDILYAANFICSTYNHYAEPSSRTNPFSKDQLIRILVYANTHTICKFAVLFNSELDEAIKSRNALNLTHILLGPKEMFVELYDNPYLSSEQHNFIMRMLAREVAAFTQVYDHVQQHVLDLDSIHTRCNTQSISYNTSQNTITALATKCYEDVCLIDSNILREDAARAIMAQNETPPENIYTVDKLPSQNVPSVYCFNTLDLMEAMMHEPPLNPKTQQPLSPQALTMIRNRFAKELALYRRFHDTQHT